MTRQDLNGKLYADVEQVLGAELDAYVKRVNEIMDVEGLYALEQELMKEAEEYDAYLNSVEYTLPEDTTYDNTRYTRNEVAKFVLTYLNKVEVEWSHTLGLFELYNLWRNKDFVKISQKAFDSTLRILNQVKYKGYTEWKEILVVNSYLSQCHNEYSLDTAWNILISEKHNAIMDRVKLIQREQNVIDEQEVLMEE